MSSPENAFLVVEKGTPYTNRAAFKVSKNGFVIGRAWELGQPDLPFSSSYISREHAVIVYRDDSYLIIDKSRHGVRINGQPIKKETSYKLKHGDRINLSGNEAILTFYIGVYPSETLILPEQRGKEIMLDEAKREVVIEGDRIELSGHLYILFYLLYQKRGCAISRKELKKGVWPERTLNDGGEPLVGDEELVALVKRLREKLKEYHDLVDNKRGYGYLLK